MIVLKTTQEKFLAAVQAVIGIVERRHTVPILANLLIRKTGGRVELTTTDLELQLRTEAELGGDTGEFATTVNARKLADILRAMPADQTVTLTASKNRLTLQGGRSRFTLQTVPAEEFPLVKPAADFGPAFTLPQKVLRALIERVDFAMAVQDIRYFLNGVLFIADGNSLTLVATDGNRLALARAEVEHALPRQAVILPRKTALELLRLLKDANAGYPPDFVAYLKPHLAVALAKILEPFRLFFLEDVLPPEHIGYYRLIRQQCTTPQAMGELFVNTQEWLPLISERLIDYIRCRVSKVGGITPARKIAHLAEWYGVQTAWQEGGNTDPVNFTAVFNAFSILSLTF